MALGEPHDQDRRRSRHAERDETPCVDPFAPGAKSPPRAKLDAIPDAGHPSAPGLGRWAGPRPSASPPQPVASHTPWPR
jgi:hypothetical protein